MQGEVGRIQQPLLESVENPTSGCLHAVSFQLRYGIVPTLGAKVQTPVMQIRYSQDHQYVVVEDGVGTVGITNYAQEKLSDVTTVELPHVGAQVQKGDAVGVVESVKAASDFYSPVSGEILGVNEALSGKPELVNEDAEGAGWIYKIKLTKLSELDALLDREAYLAFVQEQG
jgi:glycine cleavage system H protein